MDAGCRRQRKELEENWERAGASFLIGEAGKETGKTSEGKWAAFYWQMKSPS